MADSNIQELLTSILNTKLGKDMRQAIHDGIEQCYEDGKVGAVDLVAREQIANLVAHVPEGSTKDSELVDIRVGSNGETYESAGESVRRQNLKTESILNSVMAVEDRCTIPTGNWEQGTLNGAGGLVNSDSSIRSGYIPVPYGQKIIFSVHEGYVASFHKYNENKKHIGYMQNLYNDNEIDVDFVYARVNFRMSSGDTNIDPSYSNRVNMYVDIPISKELHEQGIEIDQIKQTIQTVSDPFGEVIFEQGSMAGNGADVESDSRIRTNKIPTKKDYIYLITVPDGYLCVVNYYDESMGLRVNSQTQKQFGRMISGQDDFIRFIILREDGLNFTYENLTPDEKNMLKVYRLKTYENKIVVGNTETNEECSIVCDGNNDQTIFNILFGSEDSINIKLLSGTYHLKKLYKYATSGQNYAVASHSGSPYNAVCIEGEYPTRESDSSAVFISVDVDEEDINSEEENAVFLVPRLGTALDTSTLTNTIINMKNISILGCTYTKPLVYLDFTHAQACALENIIVRADGSKTGLTRFPTAPNTECVGIRVGYGSNNGIQNYVKHCLMYYCGKGFSCCGEHYIFEDCLAHHCYIGFAFGDRLTRGNYEHPNIMLGCSIEGCYRLMELNRYGQEEGEELEAHNTLICIGLSNENVWDIPTDEGGGQQSTKPIEEVRKGAYRGRIELDWTPNRSYPFERDGSGKKMKYTVYGANIYEGTGGKTD